MKAVVIGTGAMGPEIAAALAAADWTVAIAGRTPAGRDAAAATASKWADAVVVPALIDEATFTDADLVVETIVEDLDTKHALLRRIEPWCHPKAIITTNTSSLTIADVATPLMWPKQFAGFHFLKPAHLTGVVEIIPGPATSQKTTAFLREVAKQMDKTPLIATKDVPGFIWNRIQFAVLRECLYMVEEGVASPADIDSAVADGLAPRWTAAGPLATADLGGLRTFSTICDGLFPHLSTAQSAPPSITGPASRGEPLQAWTLHSGGKIAKLRAKALASGRKITTKRRRISGQ